MRNLVGVDIDDVLLHKPIHPFPVIQIIKLAQPQIEIPYELNAGHILIVGVVLDIRHQIHLLKFISCFYVIPTHQLGKILLCQFKPHTFKTLS